MINNYVYCNKAKQVSYR